MRLKRLTVLLLVISAFAVLFVGCAAGRGGAVEIDLETGEIIK